MWPVMKSGLYIGTERVGYADVGYADHVVNHDKENQGNDKSER